MREGRESPTRRDETNQRFQCALMKQKDPCEVEGINDGYRCTRLAVFAIAGEQNDEG